MITFVTGATGFVGNNVVRLLLERGEKVRVLVRSGSKLTPLDGLPVDIAHGDVCDRAVMNQAFQGVQRVVHCAAEVHIGWKGLERQRAINIDGARNVADAALAVGARMVHVSSIDALGVRAPGKPSDENTQPEVEVLCPYVVTKREAERMVLDRVSQGLDAVITNPGFMLGPWDWKPSSGRILLKIASGWALLAPPGANSYCDVRDVAAGILAALEKGRTGQRYILAGENLSYLDAMKILARITGRRPPFRIMRRIPLETIGRVGDLLAWFTGHESDINSAATAMSMLPKNYSSARAAAELGYQSRDLEQSATDAWAWLKQYGYVKA